MQLFESLNTMTLNFSNLSIMQTVNCPRITVFLQILWLVLEMSVRFALVWW